MPDRASEITRTRGALRSSDDDETRACPLYQAQTVARRIQPATRPPRLATPERLATIDEPTPSSALPTVQLALPAERSTRSDRPRLQLHLRRAALAALIAALLALAWLADAHHQPVTASAPRANPQFPAPTTRPRPPPTRSPAPIPALSLIPALAPSSASAPVPRTAATLLASARYPEALALYRTLAQANPTDRAYALIAEILERRLQRDCEQRAERGEQPCAHAP
jgi:hypothetical protein